MTGARESRSQVAASGRADGPPFPLPLLRGGQLRKRWRYVGFFGEEVMLCAARAQIGPLTQSFWVLWDRDGRRRLAHTAPRPGSREVRFDGPALEIDADGLRASLRLGESEPIETTCPSGAAQAWTRKRAGVPIEGVVEVPGSRWALRGHGVEDVSAGHHARHTSWRWSAGVGTATDGRPVAWNLVEGINDPPEGSERAVWVDGFPSELPPARFRDGGEIVLPEAEGLRFSAESEHARDDDYGLLRSRYRHSFGGFSGLLGGVELANGLGVVEQHDALW